MIELPETSYVLASAGDRWSEPYVTSMDGYSDDQMRDYGKACARAAMERAAQIAERLRDEHCTAYDNECEADGSDGCDFVAAWNDVAAAIRAEIEKEEGK